MLLNKVRGMKDIIGHDVHMMKEFIIKINKISILYNYQKVLLPIIEHSDIFYKNLGKTSDIVSKETYNFIDREKTPLTLRPEFTSSVVRAIFNNDLINKVPLKIFTYGPIFRHERPQRCRLRQFYQYNFEYIGSDNIMVDIELLQLAITIINIYKLHNPITLLINHLGSNLSRNKYKDKLIYYFNKYKNDLNYIDSLRLKNNPIRILDSKNYKVKQIIKNAPNIIDFLDNKEKKNFFFLCNTLLNLNIKFKVSNKLVRGLDYYTGFVFEFISENLGIQNTILGGGRYDNFINYLCNKNIPASGFAGGVERMLSLINKYYILRNKIKFLLLPVDQYAESISFKLATKLRNGMLINIIQYYDTNIQKALYKANKEKVNFCLIFGYHEIKNNFLKIKDMLTWKEYKISFKYFLRYV